MTLIGFNVFISNKFNSDIKIYLGVENIALADDEGSGGTKCYNFVKWSYDASVLDCHQCCYRSNFTSNGGFDGVCPSGAYPNC